MSPQRRRRTLATLAAAAIATGTAGCAESPRPNGAVQGNRPDESPSASRRESPSPRATKRKNKREKSPRLGSSRVVLDPRGDETGVGNLDITAAEVADTRPSTFFVRLAPHPEKPRRYEGTVLALDTHGDRRYDYFVLAYRARRGWTCRIHGPRGRVGSGRALNARDVVGCIFPRSRVGLNQKGFSWRASTVNFHEAATIDVDTATTFDRTRRKRHP